ncbi:MAG: acetylxylan esterase [Verrucomicrobiales bacterium]|nr:acetylxylan esterase [Verrucomicrobiales bacterium]
MNEWVAFHGANGGAHRGVLGWRVMLVALVCLVLEGAAQEPPDTNYDESKAGDVVLPDPLTCFDGRRVTTRRRWREVRRPELLESFATNVYGRTPQIRIHLRPELRETQTNALEGLATRRQVRLWLFDEPGAPWIDLLLFHPNATAKRVPVFLGLSYGNQGVHADPGILPSRDTVSKRGEHAHRWPLSRILERGFGVATFAGADVEQDRHGSGSLAKPDGWRSGIRGYWLQRNGRREPADTDWGSLGAWAWGLSRALDYLERDPKVEGSKVVVFGHSRTGKAALWAAAQDERFAMAISNNSGQGGAALARRWYGETLAASVSLSGIWYCRAYGRFAGRETDLPVDAHELLALLAPRPVYVASAVEDRWADPRGEFLAARHAEPVYRLFGLAGLGVEELPAIDRSVGATIGYHLRSGDHEITAWDWEQYLEFADRHLRR